ncbi:MAG: hypothetical protein RIB60_01190 [Phycisphaerales bacterium]
MHARIRRGLTIVALAAAAAVLSGCDELSVIAIRQNSAPAPTPEVTPQVAPETTIAARPELR